MQLYALDQNKKLIFAAHAAKQKDFTCLECQGVVRRRGGTHRHVHFYHLTATHSCRLNGKSMSHLHIQSYLHSLLPSGECQLECPFPDINRIADVAWHSKKIIFEVQCSSISAEEVAKRNQDYASQGYSIVWILHDNRYNQERVSAAELFLLDKPHYFANYDNDGKGTIYDQFSVVERGIRKQKMPALPVFLHQPTSLKALDLVGIPNMVSQRLQKWPFYFMGDLVDLCVRQPRSPDLSAYIMKALEIEQSLQSIKAKSRGLLHKITRAYWLVFQTILERACK